jgi:uncharacterized protein RhaS with RHS repeats
LTGLDYYGARYYDPVVGVFLSADKVQGNLQEMNPYAYVEGNPEMESDSLYPLVYVPDPRLYLERKCVVEVGQRRVRATKQHKASTPPAHVLHCPTENEIR